jgi:hypothetical protein
MIYDKKTFNRKTIFPHRYSKIFSRFEITHELLWEVIKKRLRIEKDNLIIVTGDTGTGKSSLVGNICFKKASIEPNFVTDNGTMMFEDERCFIIDPDEFAVKMIDGSGDVLWVDESRDAISSRNWASKINKTVISRKNKNRKLRKVIFILLPYEKEIDRQLIKHATLWIWVKKRGICEVYCRRSGIKGGSGLNIDEILDREQRYFKENPHRSVVPPAIHPEFVGYLSFGKLTANLQKRYDYLVDLKKATGEYTDEEKEKFGIKVKKNPKDIIVEAISKIKEGEIKDKKTLWEKLEEIELEDDKKLKLLNFHLKLEGWDSFNRLFDPKKKKAEKVLW